MLKLCNFVILVSISMFSYSHCTEQRGIFKQIDTNEVLNNVINTNIVNENTNKRFLQKKVNRSIIKYGKGRIKNMSIEENNIREELINNFQFNAEELNKLSKFLTSTYDNTTVFGFVNDKLKRHRNVNEQNKTLSIKTSENISFFENITNDDINNINNIKRVHTAKVTKSVLKSSMLLFSYYILRYFVFKFDNLKILQKCNCHKIKDKIKQLLEIPNETLVQNMSENEQEVFNIITNNIKQDNTLEMLLREICDVRKNCKIDNSGNIQLKLTKNEYQLDRNIIIKTNQYKQKQNQLPYNIPISKDKIIIQSED